MVAWIHFSGCCHNGGGCCREIKRKVNVWTVCWDQKLSLRAVLASIGPRSWHYGLRAARSVQKQPRANISPVRLKQAMLVSSLLYDPQAMLVLNWLAFKSKNTQLMTVSTTVSMEMVHMANPRPNNNQSEHLDLPQDYLAI